MPNLCEYTIKAVSKSKKSLKELYSIMNYEREDIRMYRVLNLEYEEEIHKEDGFYTCTLYGDVAWSCGPWIETDETTDECSILPDICKKLKVGVEIYSKEAGLGFQEHYLIDSKGNIHYNESVDYQENWFDDKQKMLEWPECSGGFEDYCCFKECKYIY